MQNFASYKNVPNLTFGFQESVPSQGISLNARILYKAGITVRTVTNVACTPCCATISVTHFSCGQLYK